LFLQSNGCSTVAGILLDGQVFTAPVQHARGAVLKFQRSWLCGLAAGASKLVDVEVVILTL
jgi:hypothetical protein